MSRDGPDLPMIEVEVKAPADPPSLAALRERWGPERIEEHQDTYLDHPARRFAETDEALRLRRVGDTVQLTYKGPRLDPVSKTRREVTVALDDDASALTILEALGFRRVRDVAKTRHLFDPPGWAVTYDEVPPLGTFIEVERVVGEGTDIVAIRDDALALLEELGAGPPERRSYLELLLDHEGA